MDSRIDWASLAPSLSAPDLYYALFIELGNLDARTRVEFMRLLPPQMRQKLMMMQH